MDNTLELDNQNEQKSTNAYEADFQQKTQALIECQKDKALPSCFDCEKLIECDTRDAYVKAVYQSLNQGEQTDFDF